MWWNRFGPMFAGDVRRQRVSRTHGFRLALAAPGDHNRGLRSYDLLPFERKDRTINRGIKQPERRNACRRACAFDIKGQNEDRRPSQICRPGL
jgi:hypothetical protein